jgi:hypothetical protein
VEDVRHTVPVHARVAVEPLQHRNIDALGRERLGRPAHGNVPREQVLGRGQLAVVDVVHVQESRHHCESGWAAQAVAIIAAKTTPGDLATRLRRTRAGVTYRVTSAM